MRIQRQAEKPEMTSAGRCLTPHCSCVPPPAVHIENYKFLFPFSFIMCLFLFCSSVFIVMLFMNGVLRESVWCEAQSKQLNLRLGPV